MLARAPAGLLMEVSVMNHAVISPTLRDAFKLADGIDAAGWHARIVNARGHIGVIIHAPTNVVNSVCRRVGFEPGRAIGA